LARPGRRAPENREATDKPMTKGADDVGQAPWGQLRSRTGTSRHGVGV